MKNGYEQFFKEASKASGSAQKQMPKASQKPKFKLKNRNETPEERVRAELAARLQRRSKEKIAKKRQSFPVFPAILAVAALVSCVVGYMRPDIADKVFGSIEVGAFGQAQAAPAEKPKVEKAPAKAAETTTPDAAKTAETEVEAKAEPPKDFRQWSDEEISFFSKLNDRKKELDLKEAELAKLEEELQKQKAELDEKIKKLESMRGEISKTLQTRVANDQEKVGKLVEFYSNMKPAQASKVIESLNEDLAVEILEKMKKKIAAEIMNMMDAKKARRLSELLTGYQRTPASEAEAKSEAKAPKSTEDEDDETAEN
jgi:flagellar motility protein MotE (MotC chaperone)